MGLAQTGTGKTAAFALPILQRLSAGRGSNPRALIVAPTRELAMQIHAEIEMLGKFTNVRSMTVFGGVSASPQIRGLKKRPDIVVACPGRLLDLMNGGHADLRGIEVLVLDEADHMLDMGFLPDIKRLLARLPERRQSLLFSATMPREIRSLSKNVLRNPHVVELAHSSPAETIEHALYPVDQTRKAELLQHLLRTDNFRSAIVFLRTKHRARRLAKVLDRDGHRAIALQGNMSQGQRERAMQGFRDGKYDVLVATDIAARGIDVAQVSHVINFDVPNTPDAYTHRIGRTGRSERSGKAYTMVTPEDLGSIKDIERKLKLKIPRVNLSEFRSEDAPAQSSEDHGRVSHQRGGAGRRAGGSRSQSPASGRRGGDGGDSRSRNNTGAGGAKHKSASSSDRSGVWPASAPDSRKPQSDLGSSRTGRASSNFGAGVGDGSSQRRSDSGNRRGSHQIRNRALGGSEADDSGRGSGHGGEPRSDRDRGDSTRGGSARGRGARGAGRGRGGSRGRRGSGGNRSRP
ncbi:MAG: ATP-dependent RNA helicase RhlE [Planctomycetota bacterium]|jgi:ATP-dependent RNA helicase RhlE